VCFDTYFVYEIRRHSTLILTSSFHMLVVYRNSKNVCAPTLERVCFENGDTWLFNVNENHADGALLQSAMGNMGL
jgi:hypothetical protein